MSYEIFYRHQFIDLKDGRYLPYIECGSSNCYDAAIGRNNRMRRSRSFEIITPPDCPTKAPTAQQLLDTIEAYIQRTIEGAMTTPYEWAAKSAGEVLKSFGFWTSLAIGGAKTIRSTAGMYRGFYLSGMKYAKPIEELSPAFVRVWPFWEDTLKEKGKPILPAAACRTSEELRAAIDRFEAAYGTGTWGVEIYSGTIETAIRDRAWANAQKRQAAENKPRSVRPGYWVLRAGPSFFQRMVRGGHYYGYTTRSAKKFDTQRQAQRYAEKYGLKYQPEYFANI